MKTARRTLACFLAVLLLLMIAQASAFAEPGGKNASAVRLSAAGKSSETRSGTGSWLSDIRYSSDGTIASLTERIGRSVSDWEYRYDARGGFLYRVKNIGSVPSKLAAGYMPGTDVNYSALSSPVYDCVGFTIDYEVTKLRKGDGIGDRWLYTFDGEEWSLAGSFAYDSYGRTSARFAFCDPITVVNFTTPRIHADDSSFMIEQSLRDVLIADFTYVCPEWMEPLESCYLWPYEGEPYGPGPDDLIGQNGVAYPHDSWLADYESQVVRGTTSGNAYLRWSPSNEGREYKRYVSEGEWVTVLARESGYSLVLTWDGRAGWVTSKLLSYR